MTALYSLILSLSGSAILVVTLLLSVHFARKKNKFSPFTEKLLRSPAYTLGQKLDDKLTDLLMYMLPIGLVPVFFLFVYKTLTTPARMVIGLLVVLIISWGIKKLMRLYKELRALRLGMDGEVYTGQELNFLMRQGAYVFHDIPYKYGNIDHIVVSSGGVFAVETKAVRKPAGKDGKRQSKVRVEGDKLHFPHAVTSAPVSQAKRHAEHIRQFLQKKTGEIYPIKAVVALPGWYVEADRKGDCLVINPKRGGGLRSFVGNNVIPKKETEIIANYIEDFARTVQSGVDRSDPDAHKKYDFWLNRKHEEDKL